MPSQRVILGIYVYGLFFVLYLTIRFTRLGTFSKRPGAMSPFRGVRIRPFLPFFLKRALPFSASSGNARLTPFAFAIRTSDSTSSQATEKSSKQRRNIKESSTILHETVRSSTDVRGRPSSSDAGRSGLS
jgi:hypothetical protein